MSFLLYQSNLLEEKGEYCVKERSHLIKYPLQILFLHFHLEYKREILWLKSWQPIQRLDESHVLHPAHPLLSPHQLNELFYLPVQVDQT